MPTLADHLSAEHVIWFESEDKNAALSRLLQLVSSSRFVHDPLALEHAILAIGISTGGIAYGSLVDDQPVKLICMVAGPEGRNAEYLKLLSVLMKFIKSEKGLILNASHPDEVRRYAANYEVPGGF